MCLHPKRSKLESLSLGAVYKYIHDGADLEGAHDSMVDVRAQTDLLLHPYFVPYLDRTDSFCSVDDIFGKNQLSEMRRQLEPSRPVHAPWNEQKAEENIEWQPSAHDSYTGPSGGGLFGPTLAMSQIVRTATM